MLKHVLKATVRGSGQGSHARLIYGLASAKEQSASARDAQIVARARPTRKPDFTSPRVANPP